MLTALFLVSCICFVMPFTNDFWFSNYFYNSRCFLCPHQDFGFTSIGLVTNTDKEHSSFMGFLEGFFMIGVLAGNVLFSLFIDDHNPKSTHWLNVYWVLGVLSSLSFIFLFFSKLNEKEAKVVQQI